MGIRETQFIGISPRAAEAVSDLHPVILDGRCVEGMYDEKIPLARYVAATEAMRAIMVEISDLEVQIDDAVGRLVELAAVEPAVCREVEQEVFWSSGPVIFTTLVDENGADYGESAWTDDEMSVIIGEEIMREDVDQEPYN